jgi:signal peptidase II
LLAFDQFTKHLTLTYLKGNPSIVLIPDVLEFTYVENRGSAFGMLQGQKVLLISVAIVFITVIVWLLFKTPTTKKYIPLHILMVAIMAGGIGNMIDRIQYEYVVDFISFVLIHFPVFNVADCYIVVATILLFVLTLFVYKEEDLDFIHFRNHKKIDKTTDQK